MRALLLQRLRPARSWGTAGSSKVFIPRGSMQVLFLDIWPDVMPGSDYKTPPLPPNKSGTE